MVALIDMRLLSEGVYYYTQACETIPGSHDDSMQSCFFECAEAGH